MPQDTFAKYPLEVRNRTEKPFTVYRRSRDHYAVHRLGADVAPSGDAVATMREEDRLIEIFRGTPDTDAASPGDVGPVYAAQSGGSSAVPTGRVFVRFKDGVRAGEYRQQIERAGYEIEQSPEYAPHTAWLRSRSGKIIDALAGVQALEKIDDVENVEPQMLMQRVSR
jgi:hypothetical protein